MNRIYYQIIDEDTDEVVAVSRTKMCEKNNCSPLPDYNQARLICMYYSGYYPKNIYIEILSRDDYLYFAGKIGMDVYNKKTGEKIYEGETINTKPIKDLVCNMQCPSAIKNNTFLSYIMKKLHLTKNDIECRYFYPKKR